MPERQIPWKRVAFDLGGTFEARTLSTQSRYVLRAVVEGQRVEVRGRSTPYGTSGNVTEIFVEERQLLGLKVGVFRERERTSFWRNLLWRDVEVGDAAFDLDWFLRAKRDADAQLVIDVEARRLIQAVPPLTYEHFLAPKSFYEYVVTGGVATAQTKFFDMDEERLMAAIRAVVGLTRWHERLRASWTQLARDLDGRLETAERLRIDKGVAVVFPMRGKTVRVSLSAQKGRLYTRVSCPCPRGHHPFPRAIVPHKGVDGIGLEQKVASALEAASVARVFKDADMICAELAGNVTDVSRLLAAATVVTELASTDESGGPYR